MKPRRAFALALAAALSCLSGCYRPDLRMVYVWPSIVEPPPYAGVRYAFEVENVDYPAELFVRPASAQGPVVVQAYLSSDGVARDGGPAGGLQIVPAGSALATGARLAGSFQATAALDPARPYLILTVVPSRAQTDHDPADNSLAALIERTPPAGGSYCTTRERPGSAGIFEMLIAGSGSGLTATAEGVTLSGILSGRNARLSGAAPDAAPLTVLLRFADDGASFTGTLTVGAEVSTLTGRRDPCFTYAFPAGDPQCVLPTPDPGLVVWGQQFNSVHAGVTHTGLDFKIVTPLPAIGAPCDGVVVEITRHTLADGNLITDVVIKYNDGWRTFVAFEPFSPDPAIADRQASSIAVRLGQVVRRGELLGNLVVPDPVTEFPHVHWQVHRNDAAHTPACPRDFLAPADQATLDTVYASFGLFPPCLPAP